MGTKLLKFAFFSATTAATFAAGVGVGAMAIAYCVAKINEDVETSDTPDEV